MSETQSNTWKTKLIAIIVAVVFILGSLAFIGWYNLARKMPLTYYQSPAEHFKYGSIGTENVEGIPYWIWVVLPRLFPEKLPGIGGYTSLGLTWEEGKEMPIGLTKEKIGIDRVGMNCAVCHVGTIRKTPKDKLEFLLGGPTTKFDVQRYVRFLFDCAHDPRFNANFILPEIEYNHHLSLWENLLYRLIIIPRTKQALLEKEKSFSWMDIRPDYGPSRTDMNPLKIEVLGLKDDGSIGSTDVMAIWNEDAHEGFYKHSDGLNTSLREAVLSSALGTGTNRQEINLTSLERIETWLRQLPPPPYPFAIDNSLANKGAEIFANNCASCHAFGGSRTGQVISLTEVLTDPNRANHWTQEASDAFNQYAENYSWDFDNFRDSDGYTSLSLDGVWARAPYLHNGSVPSLKALLDNPQSRPQVFYRGYDVYDRQKVGFISEGEKAEQVGFKYDTHIVGNSNQGHIYGTDLPQNDKKALLEYLKTL